MTTPVVSLFSTPPEAAAPNAAPSAGPTAGSDAVFETLVSAFLQATENATSSPQTQSQTPHGGASIPVEPVKADLTFSEQANTDPTQKNTHALEHAAPTVAAEHGLQIAALHTDLPFAIEDGVLNKPALPQQARVAPDSVSNVRQNKNPNASSPRIDASISADLTQASTSDASAVEMAPAELPDEDSAASDTSKVTLSERSPLMAKEDKAARAEKTADDPVLDMLSISEIAPRVVTQFLAAQTQVDVPRTPAETDDSAIGTQTQEPAPASGNDPGQQAKTAAANDAAASAPPPTGQTGAANGDTAAPIQPASPELASSQTADAEDRELGAPRRPIRNSSAEIANAATPPGNIEPGKRAERAPASASATDSAAIIARSSAPLAPDTADAARVSVPTIERDGPKLSAVIQRQPRGPGREASDDKPNTADQAVPSATRESKTSRENTTSFTTGDFQHGLDTPKTVAKITAPHSPEPGDTVKSDQTSDVASAAEFVPPQPVKAEAPDVPNQPQLPPAAADVFTSAIARAHNFEMPSAHATAPAQDVPVKFAFSAPNVPDNAAFDAMALKIASHSSDGDSRFSIRLDPPELGKIEVNLNVDAGGHAHAELSADKPQTLDILQKDASSLERALKDAGLNLSGGLAFSLKGEGRSQAWRDGQNGRSRSLHIAAAANTALAARAAQAHAYGISTSHLDIRV